MVVFTTWTPWKLRIFHFVSDQLIHIICIITFRTRLIQTWSSTHEIHKCTAVLIRIVMLQRSELYTDAIRLRAYGSDTYLMTLQNWSTSVNLSVSFTKGNGTVSCLNIFGCVWYGRAVAKDARLLNGVRDARGKRNSVLDNGYPRVG